jgi:hypothetical protein
MSIITKTEENSKELSKKLSRFCKDFGVYHLLRRFGAEKTKGISLRIVFDFVFSLVFSGKNLYHSIQLNQNAPLAKDTVYRFLNNTKIHWERILFALAVSVITRIRSLTGEDRMTAIVIDDSPYSRNRSKKVELLSKVYDHVAHTFFMGFRMLTMGFTDGNTFIPIAKQLMSSEKASNPATITDGRTIAGRRRKNAIKEMPQRIYELLRMAKSFKIPAAHVLFDSWFSNPVTLMTIKDIGFFCVSMLRKNKTKYLYQGEKKTLCQIHSSIKKRPGRSKYLASAHITLSHHDFNEPIPAVIVFVRDKSNKKKWCALISTDTTLSEEKIIELYGKRWDIEVFFKMCKSYLKLAKEFEGRSYDMMTAHTTIVFLRYICLAWEQRQSQDLRCFGELFFLISDEPVDISFAHALELLLVTLVETLREALFLSKAQIAVLLDNFFLKLPPYFADALSLNCES